MPAKPVSYRTISVTRNRSRIVNVTLARGDVLNVINRTMVVELQAAFEQVAKSPATRAVVLTGAGNVFCAGADFSLIHSEATVASKEDVLVSSLFSNMIQTIAQCPKPVIGLVQGMAYGAGLALCSACDIIIAAPATKFSVSELYSGMRASSVERYLIDTVNQNPILNLALMQRMFGGIFAEKIGLVHCLVEPEKMQEAANAALKNLKRHAAAIARQNRPRPDGNAVSQKLAL